MTDYENLPKFTAQLKKQHMTTQELATEMVAYLQKGDFEGAQKALLANTASSTEPAGAMMPDVTGLEAIIAKGHQFQSMIETVHGITVTQPIVAGEFFSIGLIMDITMKGMGHQKLDELIVYHVKEGKVASEQYFYTMG